MSARKFVRQQLDTTWPEPTGRQFIARAGVPKGNNLHNISTASGEEMLASMPTRFRKNVWMKRGDYLIAEPIDEGIEVRAEINCILLKDQVRHLKQIGAWPAEFDDTSQAASDEIQPKKDASSDKKNSDNDEEKDSEYGSDVSSSEDESDLVRNTNRRHFEDEDDDDSDSSDDDED